MNANDKAKETPSCKPGAGGKPGWDLKELMSRLDDDRELLRELLQMFQTDARTNMQMVADSVKRNDPEGAVRAAHTLKGMLKNLAMNVAADIAAAMEDAARGRNIEQVAAQMPLLEKALEELKPEIESQLSEVHV